MQPRLYAPSLIDVSTADRTGTNSRQLSSYCPGSLSGRSELFVARITKSFKSLSAGFVAGAIKTFCALPCSPGRRAIFRILAFPSLFCSPVGRYQFQVSCFSSHFLAVLEPWRTPLGIYPPGNALPSNRRTPADVPGINDTKQLRSYWYF